MHGTLRFLFSFISPIVWNMCENLHHESDGYIWKSYSTSKNTIDRQYTERGQPKCQLSLVIGRGCLVFLKFKSSLCWRMLCFKALLRLCSFDIKLPCVNPTSPRADSQWIIILKTFELVTLTFSQYHAQRNWLLTHALHISDQYMRLLCCFGI